MAALEIENKLMAREATQVQGKKGGGTDSIQQPLSRGTFGGNFPLCGFLVAQMVKKKSACNAGDPGLIPGSGRSPGEGNGNPLQDSCLENLMDTGAWWAAVRGITKSRARVSD